MSAPRRARVSFPVGFTVPFITPRYLEIRDRSNLGVWRKDANIANVRFSAGKEDAYSIQATSRDRAPSNRASASEYSMALPLQKEPHRKWKILNSIVHTSTSPSFTLPPHSNDLQPESCPALVLNADYNPLSYMPLSLWPWQEAVKAVFLDRVTVVATYDIGIKSPGMIFPLPSVISLKQYQPARYKTPAFTRFNVFLRDSFTCQYCGNMFPVQDLTFDHVVPRYRGGETVWDNVATACATCNIEKGGKTLRELRHMKLRRPPREPSAAELQSNARKFPPKYLHDSWRDYVFWNHIME